MEDERITDEIHGGTLVSDGERNFELGFFTPTGSSSHNRFVGIWYRLDPQTVVWVANRNHPIPDGATGVIRIADGKLKVFDTARKEYWSIDNLEISPSRNLSVKLMDSGNLVLSDDQSEVLWESFKNPTNTFLPGMKMDEKLKLTSWAGVGDPGMGNYTFIRTQYEEQEEDQGRYRIQKSRFDYWIRSWRSSSEETPVDNEITNLLSNSSKNKKYHNINADLARNNSLRRLVIDYTGKLQYFRWFIGEGIWRQIWSEPGDKCSIHNPCGKFGVCNINNKNIGCKCLPGFKPAANHDKWNSREFSGGWCSRKSELCGESETTFLGLKMMKVSNTNLTFPVENETNCRNECLKSCECQAYSYQEIHGNNSMRRSDNAANKTCLLLSEEDLAAGLQEEYEKGRNLSVRVAKSDIGTPTDLNIIAII